VRVFDPVAGGEALLVLEMGGRVNALAAFTDPATGAPRLACTAKKKVLVEARKRFRDVRIFDAVSGGDALLVLDVGSEEVAALVAFEDLTTGAPRLAIGSEYGFVRVFDPVAGGAPLVVLFGHADFVSALTAFTDPVTGDIRLVSGSGDGTARVWNPVASGVSIEAESEGHSAQVCVP
jgi:WD40 repeat protein